MSDWKKVGTWIKDNAGPGAALVGSLLTGNVPAAVAAGVALVSSATGTAVPADALAALQGDPATIVRLRELANEEATNIRAHIQRMTELELADAQAEHRETQETIRAGDKSESAWIRFNRPGMCWASLFAAIIFVFAREAPDEIVLGLLLTPPWTYLGLRQWGKRTDAKLALGGK